jgi:hypothetical protein
MLPLLRSVNLKFLSDSSPIGVCSLSLLVFIATQGRKKASASALEGVEDFFPPNFHRQAVSGGVAPEMSGKFMVLDRLLREVRATTDDRCVLISNYTQVWCRARCAA